VATAFALGAAPVAAAPDQVGRVLAASGVVVATGEDGSTRTLSGDGRVYEGDTIKTPRGRVQIRFADGGLVSLKRGTRFAVKRYDTGGSSGGDAEASTEAADESGGNVVMRLFEGAMRTITGSVGGDEADQYRMETPVATLGVRGTQYGLQYCGGGNCGGDAQGLYGQVVDSSVTVSNEAGQADFGQGRYFQVPGEDAAPKSILKPPESVLSSRDVAGGEGVDALDQESESGEDDEESTDEQQSPGDEQGTQEAAEESTDEQQSPGDEQGTQEAAAEEVGAADSTTGDAALTGGAEDDTLDANAGTQYSQTDEQVNETADAGDEVALSELDGEGVVAGVVGTDSEFGLELAFGAPCISGKQCTAETDGNGDIRRISSELESSAQLPDDTTIDKGTEVSFDATGADLERVESGTIDGGDDLSVRWGRWQGDTPVNAGGFETTFEAGEDGEAGGFLWARTANPTTEDQLASVFSAEDTATYDRSWSDSAGPTAVGSDAGKAWEVNKVSVTMEFTAGDNTADISAGGVELGLSDTSTSGGASFTLKNGESVTVKPKDRGFGVTLEQDTGNDFKGENEGALSGTFAGDQAQGLLAAFRAIRNNEEGNIEEAIQGVKILKEE